MEENQDVMSGTQDIGDVQAEFDSLFNFESEGADQAPEQEQEQGESESEEENAETVQQESGAQDEPKYKVKYYGEEQEMTVSQLVAAAQKGMDYDNVRTKLDAAQNDPARKLVESLAAQNGMDVQEYLMAAQQGMQSQQTQPLVEQGMSEELAREVLEERAHKASIQAALDAQEKQKADLEPWMELRREYPQMTQIAPQVAKRIAQGESPIAAMRGYELEQLRAQMAAQKAADKNKQTTPGSASGLGGNDKNDPFEQGFNAGFGF